MSPPRGERIAVVLVGAFLAAIIASLLLAPMALPTICTDVEAPGISSCVDLPAQTLLGVEANIWLWLGSVMLIVVVAGMLIAAPRRGRTP